MDVSVVIKMDNHVCNAEVGIIWIPKVIIMFVDHALIQEHLEDVFNAIEPMDVLNANQDFSNFFINVINLFGDYYKIRYQILNRLYNIYKFVLKILLYSHM